MISTYRTLLIEDGAFLYVTYPSYQIVSPVVYCCLSNWRYTFSCGYFSKKILSALLMCSTGLSDKMNEAKRAKFAMIIAGNIFFRIPIQKLIHLSPRYFFGCLDYFINQLLSAFKAF